MIIFLTFLAIQFFFRLYLNLRNQRHIQRERHQVPTKFTATVTLQEHQKAADYTLAKSRLALFSLSFSTVILLGWTWGGGLNALNAWVISFQLPTISQGLLLFLGFGGVSLILGLPESLYSTFILEEKFGFNQTTIKTFVVDLIKQLILGALLGLPLLWAILKLIEAFPKTWWLWGFALFSAFQLFLLWIYPCWLAPLFNKFKPLEEGDFRQGVEELLKKIDFPHQELFVMDASRRSSHGNAYFTGFGKKKRIVLFDTLLKNLSVQQAQAVLAHEVGHYKKNHILQAMLKSFIFSLLGFFILSQLQQAEWFYQMHFVKMSGSAMLLLLSSLVSSVYTFYLTPLSSWLSRKNEFEADEYATQHASGNDLIAALVGLSKDNASFLAPDPLYSKFYYSHPPLLERVHFIESLL